MQEKMWSVPTSPCTRHGHAPPQCDELARLRQGHPGFHQVRVVTAGTHEPQQPKELNIPVPKALSAFAQHFGRTACTARLHKTLLSRVNRRLRQRFLEKQSGHGASWVRGAHDAFSSCAQSSPEAQLGETAIAAAFQRHRPGGGLK